MAASNSSNKTAGEESQNVAAAQAWFTDQRLSPNGAVNNDAFAAVAGQAATLPTTGGAWTERTDPAGPGVDFSDSPQYIDPTSNFSNSGAGDRWVAGRTTALAAAPDGSLFVGAADGGVWKSTDQGVHWKPVTDNQGTLSIGALLVVPSTKGYTVYAGTGEANTSSDSYAGVGVIASSDGGSKWARVGGSELNGALIFRLASKGATVLAATSHGLYSFNSAGGAGWTAVLQPAGPPSGGNFNLVVGNMITDVAVVPGTGGSQVLAVAGWRGGAPTNGLYLSSDGGASFALIANPQGWVPAKAEGRTTLAFSASGDRAYAIVQSPQLLNVGTNGKTLLQGVYESGNGNPAGPWTKIADAEKLQSSGSAQAISRIGKGYAPGVQAWYNQFLAVDPTNSDHLYLGLEEVYETQNGGAGWNTIAPYWNFGFSCFSYSPFEGTCNHNQAHSDQHAAIIANGTLYIGNDGGVYSRSTTNHNVGDWTNLNQHLDVLQYYSAAGSGDSVLYGGLQDNGSNKVFKPTGSILDDQGHPINVSSVQVFGGDGGYTLVDPANSNNVITEYVGLTALKSTDGGANWHFIQPADPDPRFIAPIAMDRTNPGHLLAGGAIVWNSESGIAGTTAGTGASTDWQNIFDTRTAVGATTAAQVTALDAVTIGTTQYVAAAWCGPCNGSFSTGGGFRSGIVMLQSSGTGWTVTSNVCTGTSATCSASGIPDRYISGVRIDTADPTHAYLALSGFSRKWMIGPDDPGVGHVFESKTGGVTWSNVSVGLPDVPTDDVVYERGKLVVATDFGVFTSANDGATWARFGTGLPNVVVAQLTQDPNGNLVAATHGRGVWTIAAP
ncbi:MAG TPA: glycosyl hydrolase [Candidatus Dormibacteraeota bacterium]